jgi:hypothetical protein
LFNGHRTDAEHERSRLPTWDGAMTGAEHDDEQPRSGAAPVDETVDQSRPAQRLDQQTLWVDAQIRQAIAGGDFDNLPGAGKPIEGIGETHDPEWWVKNLIKREQISGVGPPAIMLRKEDAELNDRLDRISAEAEVRRILADFNARVVHARRQLQGGPPVVTPTRDIDAEIEAWIARRAARRRERRASTEPRPPDDAPRPPKRRWWRRHR